MKKLLFVLGLLLAAPSLGQFSILDGGGAASGGTDHSATAWGHYNFEDNSNPCDDQQNSNDLTNAGGNVTSVTTATVPEGTYRMDNGGNSNCGSASLTAYPLTGTNVDFCVTARFEMTSLPSAFRSLVDTGANPQLRMRTDSENDFRIRGGNSFNEVITGMVVGDEYVVMVSVDGDASPDAWTAWSAGCGTSGGGSASCNDATPLTWTGNHTSSTILRIGEDQNSNNAIPALIDDVAIWASECDASMWADVRDDCVDGSC